MSQGVVEYEFFYSIIKCFHDYTGCPMVINTSFNIRGEPIVCTVEDAYKCFMGTELDLLVCENYILNKDDQNKQLISNYKDKVELD